MGIKDIIRAATTGELSVLFVDKNNETKAKLAQSSPNSFTSELKILRGDFAKILYDCIKNSIEYIFGNYIGIKRVRGWC